MLAEQLGDVLDTPEAPASDVGEPQLSLQPNNLVPPSLFDFDLKVPLEVYFDPAPSDWMDPALFGELGRSAGADFSTGFDEASDPAVFGELGNTVGTTFSGGFRIPVVDGAGETAGSFWDNFGSGFEQRWGGFKQWYEQNIPPGLLGPVTNALLFLAGLITVTFGSTFRNIIGGALRIVGGELKTFAGLVRAATTRFALLGAAFELISSGKAPTLIVRLGDMFARIKAFFPVLGRLAIRFGLVGGAIAAVNSLIINWENITRPALERIGRAIESLISNFQGLEITSGPLGLALHSLGFLFDLIGRTIETITITAFNAAYRRREYLHFNARHRGEVAHWRF